MRVRITAGRGFGQIVDLVPAVAQARIAGKTAVAVDDQGRETAALDPGAKRGEKPEKKKAAKVR